MEKLAYVVNYKNGRDSRPMRCFLSKESAKTYAMDLFHNETSLSPFDDLPEEASVIKNGDGVTASYNGIEVSMYHVCIDE